MKNYIFKTNISSAKTAHILLNLLPLYFKIKHISFNQTELNGVFKIKAKELVPAEVQNTIKNFGYRCQLVQKNS